MCSYNAVNGIPACANGDLLQKARSDWGFKGYITSDCDAVATMKIRITQKHCSVYCFESRYGYKHMKRHVQSAIDKGKVSEKDVNQALSNLFSVLFLLGLFGNPENSQLEMLSFI